MPRVSLLAPILWIPKPWIRMTSGRKQKDYRKEYEDGTKNRFFHEVR
jgi:hypothetical protein